MSQEIDTQNFADDDEKTRTYTLNTTFVLITCDIGEEGTILEKISNLKPFSEIQQTIRQYDIIVKFEGMNRTELSELINKEIRSIKAVHSVMTLPPVSLNKREASKIITDLNPKEFSCEIQVDDDKQLQSS